MRRHVASALVVIGSVVLNGMVARHAYGQTTTSSSVPVTLPSTTSSTSTTVKPVAPVRTSTVVPPAGAPRTEIVSISPAPTLPTTTTVPPPAAAATDVAAPPRPLPGPVPIPAQSLGSPEIGALVQALEALAGRAGRLRSAVVDGRAALEGVEQELRERRQAAETAFAAARALRAALAADEALLRELQTHRREASRPRTSPRALPVLQITQPGPGRAAAYEQLRRAEDELVPRIDAQRQALRRADQRAVESQSAAAATAGEVERRREALVLLREELAGVPSEAELAAGLAAALAADRAGGRPSDLALADIPADYLDLYRRAAVTCPDLSWTVLAAIGSVESSHGRADLAGVRTGTNSAGAMGPMQFLAETWAAYGVDGDHDGVADVYGPTDSVFGAANYLCASGAGDPSRLAGAIWAYNHADWYVAAVLARAAAYGTTGFGAVPADAAALARHPNLVLSAEARADLLSGEVDPRVLAALAAAVADHRIEVTVIKTGHTQFVRGTDRVSNHYHGRGVDISSVDRAGVSSSNQAAFGLAVAFLTADPSVRPHELGSPWPELAHFPGAFSDADHTGHLHLGWRANPPEFHQVKDSGQ